MKKRKNHTRLWLIAGSVFSLLAILVVFSGLMGKVLVTDPEGIPETANAVLTCIQTGSWDDVEKLVAGNPVLSPDTGSDASAEEILWRAYQQSLQWSLAEEFMVQDSYAVQNVTITCLNIPEAVNAMAEHLNDAPKAEDSECWSQILAATAIQVLEKDSQILQEEIRLTLQRQQGTWVVVPDQAFLQLMSGFMTS